ncbi:GbsR/MarR family transcriptional regulator [Aquibacillus sediminis]|uniref:GbsR/MarR family transcriptional regulator n=1 Tax=Aquibacillus sediminis TaxID=2574734 RepID=UPI001487034C|nr:transcriptional regulator [Aquibacillus sediminis]
MKSDQEILEESHDVMISAIAQAMVVYGVNPSVGRIYGVLYFSDRPLTLDELKDQVAMSKASVSNGIRELIDTEMVTKVWKKGQRKDHYIAEKDFLRNFLSFFIKMLRLERGLIMKAVEQTEPVLENLAEKSNDPTVSGTAKRDLELLNDSRNYLNWIMRLANAMESGEIFQYFPKTERNES